MKLILFATVICAFLTVNAQKTPVSESLSEQEWEKLFSALEADDWEKSAELSEKYIARLKSDDPEKTLARLRYMLLFSSAGKVVLGRMTYEELQKVADPLVGHEVQLPYGKIFRDCQGNM